LNSQPQHQPEQCLYCLVVHGGSSIVRLAGIRNDRHRAVIFQKFFSVLYMTRYPEIQ
jgi:hypothetical protein